MKQDLTDFDPAPLSKAVVLDPRWLEEALRHGGGATPRLAAVELVETIGFSCLILRVRLTFRDPRPDLPTEVSLKGLFGTQHPEYLRTRVLVAESLFYRDVAPHTTMFVPRCFYAGLDETSGAGVVILEDVVAGGGKFFSGLDAFTPDQVRQTLGDLALLHGWSWNVSPATLPQLQSMFEQLGTSGRMQPARISELLAGPRGAALAPSVRDGRRLLAALERVRTRNHALPVSLLHGDTHAGNVFQLHGRFGLLDWQALNRGHWSTDVSYHIGAMLTVEDRRQHEQELLRFYLDRLRASGGRPGSWETAWQQYREAAAYGYFMWAITERVTPAIIEANVLRLGTAVMDHQSLES